MEIFAKRVLKLPSYKTIEKSISYGKLINLRLRVTRDAYYTS